MVGLKTCWIGPIALMFLQTYRLITNRPGEQNYFNHFFSYKNIVRDFKMKHTAAAAISKIFYKYQRKTNDWRATVRGPLL